MLCRVQLSRLHASRQQLLCCRAAAAGQDTLSRAAAAAATPQQEIRKVLAARGWSRAWCDQIVAERGRQYSKDAPHVDAVVSTAAAQMHKSHEQDA